MTNFDKQMQMHICICTYICTSEASVEDAEVRGSAWSTDCNNRSSVPMLEGWGLRDSFNLVWILTWQNQSVRAQSNQLYRTRARWLVGETNTNTIMFWF